MMKLNQCQEEVNESLINLMCLTFNKKEMKRLIEIYINTNKLIADLNSLKTDINSFKEEMIDK